MFREKNQTLVSEGRRALLRRGYGGQAGDRRSLWGCDLKNGVVSRSSLLKHDNLSADDDRGKCGLQLISDQLVQLLNLGHESFPIRGRSRGLRSSTHRWKCNRRPWLRSA